MRYALLLLALCQSLLAQAGEAAALFDKHVAPLLQAKCAGCHGPQQQISGFNVASREALLKGGTRGAALVPGAPAKSLLLGVLDHSHEVKMPPGQSLPSESVAAVRRWIELGAPWNAAGPAQTAAAPASDDTWAFQPLRNPAVPAGAAHPVDAFLNAPLAAKGLPAAGPADRRTLIRRATFDLHGLPPTPHEVAAFVSDPRPDAWERLLDRLLASPRYGERWGRHWLDVVRYADSGGFSNDFERPNAWRYRDYVIRSFNRDTSFRQFILEQIAGDELDPADPEKLVATGFLRMGPWEHTGMSVAAITRQEWLDDVTHTTAATFLGVTLECARCHDHKFDPIPTREYYSIQAAFAATEFAERPAPFLPFEIRPDFARGRQELELQQTANQARLAEFEALVRDRFRQAHPNATDAEIAAEVRTKKGLSAEEFENFKVFQKRAQLLERSLQRYAPTAYSVSNGPWAEAERAKWNPPSTFILPVGNLEAPGAQVTPAILSAVHWTSDSKLPAGTTGRRLALARWIADPRNPLTYRTIVNRVWQGHFGKGLAETPNDLGKMGRRPSHPELLDYLAARFLADGASFKQLHKLLMTSAAYQRSSAPPDAALLKKLDPSQSLYSTFISRRLEAEVIRDSILSVSGELNLDAGGPGVFPEINADLARQPVQIMGTLMPAYRPSATPAERHRRTIYTFQKRNLVDPLLEVFNGPSLAESVGRRDATTLPTQAYALLNSAFAQDMALALAARAAHARDPIADVFARTFQRTPSADEKALLDGHWKRRQSHYAAHPAPPPAPPQPLLRRITSELTGDSVTVREMDPPVPYVPNLQPHQVSPSVRALADVALILLNSNEFLYRD